MNEESAGSKRAAGAVELLSMVQFQDELRQAGRFSPRPATPAALAAVVHKITQHPMYAESRLLTRILVALTYQEGEFRRAEVATLDVSALTMAVALVDEHAAGISKHEDWIRAVDTARAAQGEDK